MQLAVVSLLSPGEPSDAAGAEPGARPDAGELYDRYAGRILGWYRAERAPDPEDLVGEVFVQVARDLHGVDGDASALRRWLFTVAYHRLVDARRRAARRPVIADRDVPDEGQEDAQPTDPALVRALAALSPAQREVVLLRFAADLPLQEVAGLTGRTVTATKALQRRALRRLGEQLPPPG